jgi:hypothetical protein
MKQTQLILYKKTTAVNNIIFPVDNIEIGVFAPVEKISEEVSHPNVYKNLSRHLVRLK